jgi:hypothetical protein
MTKLFGPFRKVCIFLQKSYNSGREDFLEIYGNTEILAFLDNVGRYILYSKSLAHRWGGRVLILLSPALQGVGLGQKYIHYRKRV